MFNISSGRKTETIKIPEFILNSNIKIKKAFLQGLFMFDGGVDYKTCNIALISKSKDLIEQTNILLNKIGIMPDDIKLNSDNYGRYRLEISDRDKIKKCFFLFEKNTDKWYRLKEHFYGFDKNNVKIKDINDLINIIHEKELVLLLLVI